MWIRCDKIEGVRFYQTFLETLDGSKQRMVFGKRNPLCQLKPQDHLGCAYNELLIHAPAQVHNWAGFAQMATIPVSQQSDNFNLPKAKQITLLPYHTILHDTILRVRWRFIHILGRCNFGWFCAWRPPIGCSGWSFLSIFRRGAIFGDFMAGVTLARLDIGKGW